jgi:hypothetical protein
LCAFLADLAAFFALRFGAAFFATLRFEEAFFALRFGAALRFATLRFDEARFADLRFGAALLAPLRLTDFFAMFFSFFSWEKFFLHSHLIKKILSIAIVFLSKPEILVYLSRFKMLKKKKKI